MTIPAKRTWVEGAHNSFLHQLWCSIPSSHFTPFR